MTSANVGGAGIQRSTVNKGRRSTLTLVFIFLFLLWIRWHGSVPDGPALAYIGPGAGFAFLGSFLSLVVGALAGAFSFLTWPLRVAWRTLRRGRAFRQAKVKRAIFLGLDGLDPRLAEQFMSEGKLPNLAKLASLGSYYRLRTTFPSLSPVAWSTFATGVNPARHNIFDFLDRDLKSYLPQLSSARVGRPTRVLKIGRLRIPLARPSLEFRRKSKPFWTILGENGIPSTVLRIPISFPPEKFNGKQLSAMCTPDLKGTQGSFSEFSTKLEHARFESGYRYPLIRDGDTLRGEIEGPDDPFLDAGTPLRVGFNLIVNEMSAELRIEKEVHKLHSGEYTPWIRLHFRTAMHTAVSGIVRFLLTSTAPDVSLYMSPINIDPDDPALPISQPSFYAAYLANLIGPFATTGMAEDTWALNEGVIDSDAFLKQAWGIFEERETMFLSALENTRRGVVACVFDTSDRIQHMFYRQFQTGDGPHSGVVEALYRRMDILVGKAVDHAGIDTALFVLSDHGFCSFRRGVNLNSWLHYNGYLTLKNGSGDSTFLRGVDWSRTRAYALGLAGIYLNLRGRESQGTVEPGAEAEALKRELISSLSALRDGDTIPIGNVYASESLYKGPYLGAAPDLIVGYNEGYRVSWDAAVGRIAPSVIEDNAKAWSGDHCVDPVLVPGVLFANRAIAATNPGIEDLAPTALDLFGVRAPAWMEGKSLMPPGDHG
jgi:predicted AlkP superfamily phosphohydrolase/phosphomutase